jgi:hypothetical protein
VIFLLGLVDSAALYGLVSLLVCVFGLEVEMTTIHEAALHPASFLESFYATMFWSSIAYPILRLLHFGIVELRRRLNRVPLRSRATFFLAEVTWADFTNPFRGMIALKGASKVIDSTGLSFLISWGTQLLHLGWALALWGYLAVGFAIVLMQ